MFLTKPRPFDCPPATMKGVTILVVDDEPIWRSILETDLGALGYTVSAARDAEEALEQVERIPPAAAVVDLMLPGAIDGRELASRLATREDPVPAILYSAAWDAAVGRDRCYGFPCVSKSAKPADLYEVVSRAAAGRRS